MKTIPSFLRKSPSKTQLEWESLRAKVLATRFYLDTLGVHLLKKPSNGFLKELRPIGVLSGHCHVDVRENYLHPEWGCRIQLHQPLERQILLLDSLEGCQLYQAHFSMDFITGTGLDAWEVKEFIDGHSLKRWHGKQPTVHYGNTRYTALRGYQQWLTYDKGPCKLTGELYRCHNEWRLERARHLRGAGISGLKDLIGFDQEQFWRDRFLLVELDRSKLGRRILDRTRSKDPISKWYRKGIGYGDLDLHVADLAIGSARRKDAVEMQDVRDWLSREGIKAEGLFKPLLTGFF